MYIIDDICIEYDADVYLVMYSQVLLKTASCFKKSMTLYKQFKTCKG